MPKAHPKEFRDDVIAVARTTQAPLGQIAKDFGISESCLRTWLAKAERTETRGRDNPSAFELRKANKRIQLLEQENEVLRRAAAYLARDINPK